MRKVLITGIAGFAGSHLAEELSGKREVWGIDRADKHPNLSGLPGINVIKCDMLDSMAVLNVVERIRPDFIVHLAAQPSPALSITMPEETFKINVFSTLNIFEAVKKASLETVVLNISTCEVYGNIDADDLPIREAAQFKPTTPYAVSKITQDLLGYQYWKSGGLKVIRCRPFHHFGPRQADNFVTAAFAKQIAGIEADKKRERVLNVGNLEAARDFLYVKDVVSAYDILMSKGEYGEAYNICSGKAVKIREILDILLSFSKERIEVVQDKTKLRSNDVNVIYGDASKLKTLGWSAKCRIEDGLKALLDYWRDKIKRAS